MPLEGPPHFRDQRAGVSLLRAPAPRQTLRPLGPGQWSQALCRLDSVICTFPSGNLLSLHVGKIASALGSVVKVTDAP